MVLVGNRGGLHLSFEFQITMYLKPDNGNCGVVDHVAEDATHKVFGDQTDDWPRSVKA